MQSVSNEIVNFGLLEQIQLKSYQNIGIVMREAFAKNNKYLINQTHS